MVIIIHQYSLIMQLPLLVIILLENIDEFYIQL